MASNYTSAFGMVRAALVTAIQSINSAWVTSSATTFPRVEIGEMTEQRTQDKDYGVRTLYCNIDIIAKSYGSAVTMKGQIDGAVIGVNTLSMTGFKTVNIDADNVAEIIEPQEGSFTIYRIITRLAIIAEKTN